MNLTTEEQRFVKECKKQVEDIHEFYAEGTFQSMYMAQDWLKDNGYTYGSTDRGNPVACVKGSYRDFPQKWHNFYDAGKEDVDGLMVSSNWREGIVKVIILK